MPKAKMRPDAARQAEENYLKTILLLNLQKGCAHVSDLAEALDMKLTTVYAAVGKLAEKGYIQPLERRSGRRSNKQSLTFTPEGEVLAKKVLERHQTILGWLLRLGIPEAQADAEACHMEHGLTDHTMSIIRRHVEMASRFVSHGSTAPEIMQKLSEHAKIQEAGGPSGKTVSERLQLLATQLGGVEGIEKLASLVVRAGGIDRMETMLDLMASVGGIEAFHKERERCLSLERYMEQKGGIEVIEKNLGALEHAGGIEAIKLLASSVEALGGAKSVRRLKAITDRLGGQENLHKLLQTELKLWNEILARGDGKG